MNDKPRKAVAETHVSREAIPDHVAPIEAGAERLTERRAAPGDDAAIAVVLTPERAGGVRRVGDMVPGVVYVQPAREAVRLVEAKRFQYATAEDGRRAMAWLDARHAASAPPLSEPAVAADSGAGGGGPLEPDRRGGTSPGTPINQSDEE